jgi:hypothetical protein
VVDDSREKILAQKFQIGKITADWLEEKNRADFNL